MSTSAITFDKNTLVPIGQQNPAAPVTFDTSTLKPMQRLVSPKGETIYLDPSDKGGIQDKQKQGYTPINSDGSFFLQNIPGEDPLDEAKRYQTVRKTLSESEKSAANTLEMKEAAKAGVGATVATAAGVAGASGMGALGDAMSGELDFLASSPKLYAEYAVNAINKIIAHPGTQLAIKVGKGVGLVGGGAAIWKYITEAAGSK